MIQFVFKIGEENVDLATMHNPSLRKSFEDLRSSLEKHLGTITCVAHHRGPVIVIHNDGSQAVLAGFGSCCDELNSRVKVLVKQLGYAIEEFTSETLSRHISM
jgi:hypothetical protein